MLSRAPSPDQAAFGPRHLRTLAHYVILADGWRRALLALLAGACGALAMAPLDFLLALALSLSVAVWLIDGGQSLAPSGRRLTLLAAATAGWWFGFGFHLAGLWWLGAAFLVETDEFLWALPLGVVALPAGLALFHAAGFVLARLLWSAGAWRVFALAVGLGLADLARGVVLTGFPWNTYGQAAMGWLPLAQAYSLVGVEGMGVVLIAAGAAPALAATAATKRGRWLPLAVSMLVLASLAGFGALRLAASADLAGSPEGIVPGVRLRVVQPNVSQREKIRPNAGMEVVRRYVELSDRATGPSAAGIADVTHLIWPESAFPFVLAREPQALAALGQALPAGVTLLTGAVRVEDSPNGPRFFNALQVLDDQGVIVASADKVHLVPFGEYLPLRPLLERLGLRQFVKAPGSFAAGSRLARLEVPGLPPLLPLICYEAIFPAEIRAPALEAGFMLNVTNDAWFGETFGPHQHFAQARARSIELGLPLVRAANTGISAIVDPFGRIVRRLELGTAGLIDSPLPRRIEPTPFARHGRAGMTALLIGATFAAALGLFLGRRDG